MLVMLGGLTICLGVEMGVSPGVAVGVVADRLGTPWVIDPLNIIPRPVAASLAASVIRCCKHSFCRCWVRLCFSREDDDVWEGELGYEDLLLAWSLVEYISSYMAAMRSVGSLTVVELAKGRLGSCVSWIITLDSLDRLSEDCPGRGMVATGGVGGHKYWGLW